MNKKIIFKTIALTNFIVLLTAFVLYKNGSFDKFFTSNSNVKLTSPNGGTPVETTNELPIKMTDSVQIQRLSSSKSLVIIDNIKLKSFTSKPKQDSSKVNLTEVEKRMMYSSKSGIIVDPKIFQRISFPDSLITNKNKLKKKSN